LQALSHTLGITGKKLHCLCVLGARTLHRDRVLLLPLSNLSFHPPTRDQLILESLDQLILERETNSYFERDQLILERETNSYFERDQLIL
jgi:hypothetical protein